jgi:hypothetical protein
MVLLVWLSRRLTKKATIPLIALLVVAESIFCFAVPTLEAPKQITVDQTAISYLQTHLGSNYRFYDFGLISPNWGAYYGINELSAIDLPFPKNFTNYIQQDLYPGMTPSNQLIDHGTAPSFASQENALLAHFSSYEAVGVKYLTLSTGEGLDAALMAKGLKVVYQDAVATIYAMPNPTPLYSMSTNASSCSVVSTDFEHATSKCGTNGGTVLRTEDSMKGWRAFVNGKQVPITTVDGIFQSIAVPAGSAAIVFTFTPPNEKYALLLAFLTAVSLLSWWWRERRLAVL